MTKTKRKVLFWSFKLAGILVSCALPIWAVLEKFPLWVVAHGTERSIGVGVILIAIVLLIVFRRTVFDFLRERLDLRHAPPLVIWVVMLILSYILIFIGNFMRDLTTVFWMGFIGCGIGTFLTFISNQFCKEEVKPDERA